MNAQTAIDIAFKKAQEDREKNAKILYEIIDETDPRLREFLDLNTVRGRALFSKDVNSNDSSIVYRRVCELVVDGYLKIPGLAEIYIQVTESTTLDGATVFDKREIIFGAVYYKSFVYHLGAGHFGTKRDHELAPTLSAAIEVASTPEMINSPENAKKKLEEDLEEYKKEQNDKLIKEQKRKETPEFYFKKPIKSIWE